MEIVAFLLATPSVMLCLAFAVVWGAVRVSEWDW